MPIDSGMLAKQNNPHAAFQGTWFIARRSVTGALTDLYVPSLEPIHAHANSSEHNMCSDQGDENQNSDQIMFASCHSRINLYIPCSPLPVARVPDQRIASLKSMGPFWLSYQAMSP